MNLQVDKLDVNYGDKEVLKNISFCVNKGEIATIIGPNGSGKTTLIKAASRCLKPTCGNIYIGGIDIDKMNTRTIAQKLAVLPQVKNVSPDVSVEELVSYGRYPHLKFGKKLCTEDKEIVDWALEKTGMTEMRKRYAVSLSGGERQRAWIAMTLAQKSRIIILDEPTTFLDISYQLEVLELVRELNLSLGLTVIMVLHDLNQAVRYSDKILAMNNGRICCMGRPEDVVNTCLLKDIFKIHADIYDDKINNCRFLIPRNTIA
jgi:iron complex transport system ATP-binding protein